MAENSIITKKARENMVKARAGAITLPKIVGMAFGSGGVDTSGNVIVPTAEQAALKNELLRKEIDGYSFVNDTTCRYQCTLSESELAGAYISEVGLIHRMATLGTCVLDPTRTMALIPAILQG